MELRKYDLNDCTQLAQLFFHTVHTVNAKDYSKAQLDVWATGNIDLSRWNQSFIEHHTVVAEIGGNIVGFGDMDNSGYLDRLYVHKDYQRQGIATALVNALEQKAIVCGLTCFTTHASITAKAFFERLGYYTVCENRLVRSGIELTNFTMEKDTTKQG